MSPLSANVNTLLTKAHLRNTTTARNSRIPRAPIPVLAGARRPAGAVNGDAHAGLGRVAGARGVGVARLAARRGQAERLGRAAPSVLRAAGGTGRARVALGGAARHVGGDGARGEGEVFPGDGCGEGAEREEEEGHKVRQHSSWV
jgi:hypothetical protein